MAEQKEKTYMPAGIGGLIRYDEEEEEIIKVKPEYLVYGVAAFAVLIIILHFL